MRTCVPAAPVMPAALARACALAALYSAAPPLPPPALCRRQGRIADAQPAAGGQPGQRREEHQALAAAALRRQPGPRGHRDALPHVRCWQRRRPGRQPVRRLRQGQVRMGRGGCAASWAAVCTTDGHACAPGCGTGVLGCRPPQRSAGQRASREGTALPVACAGLPHATMHIIMPPLPPVLRTSRAGPARSATPASSLPAPLATASAFPAPPACEDARLQGGREGSLQRLARVHQRMRCMRAI